MPGMNLWAVFLSISCRMVGSQYMGELQHGFSLTDKCKVLDKPWESNRDKFERWSKSSGSKNLWQRAGRCKCTLLRFNKTRRDCNQK
ncbi:hypothetical protein CWB99_22255 [Pseudoalteromonas rubra]|uniref:Uncharacterized protein n=1 Tax=Pseudoalteromonas rubra TaxID=43658 RepID=A0A5S3WFV6_9GAMM|nr:hypothetical protein CWB99_22255 [Pseudoalteromonas rubra]TMP33292.1 hypothetical protein CWC00_10985 [Pseudoalteromonas rubra]